MGAHGCAFAVAPTAMLCPRALPRGGRDFFGPVVVLQGLSRGLGGRHLSVARRMKIANSNSLFEKAKSIEIG